MLCSLLLNYCTYNYLVIVKIIITKKKTSKGARGKNISNKEIKKLVNDEIKK